MQPCGELSGLNLGVELEVDDGDINVPKGSTYELCINYVETGCKKRLFLFFHLGSSQNCLEALRIVFEWRR